MKKKIKNIYFLSIIFLIIDQIIKIFILNNMVENQSIILIKNFFNITLVYNKGAAFSILIGNRLFLIIIGIIAILLLSLYLYKNEKPSNYNVFIYSILMGGILGNLMDRIVYGYVIDYLSFNIFGYSAPIFNFADICIVVSVILIIFQMLRDDLWK